MKKTLMLPVLLTVLALVVTACGGAGGGSAAKIKATWVTPSVNGDAVSLSAAEITKNTIVHFRAKVAGGTVASMAYVLGGTTHVRANICPPCRSTGFSLQGNILVCDTCGTTFKAADGTGIQGACVDFPKASVAYTLNGDSLVMTTADILTAYQNTTQPGLP